jgi:putative iron-dependent peroxidase
MSADPAPASQAVPPAAQQPLGRAQPVSGPLTGAAIFLIVTVRPGGEQAVRDLCGDLGGLLRSVGFRDLGGGLTCVVGFGSDLWDRLGTGSRPAGLHPFREILADGRHAVSTPGDLLFHIRAGRMDLCFELAMQITNELADAVSPLDEVHGFRYFDERDLLGFVDGTENPTGDDAVRATVIGAEDPDFAGGSYVIVQKYVHDLDKWNALPIEQQENVIGRYKLSNVEQADDVKPSYAHNALTSLTAPDGSEIQILRDNMPFGRPSDGEYGTYFIGYARSPDPIEQMLQNMFVGLPPGNYDRILDVSTAVTGVLFFVPSMPLLESLADDDGDGNTDGSEGGGDPDSADGAVGGGTGDGSLGIGGLGGAPPD